MSKMLPIEKYDSFVNYFNNLVREIKEDLGRDTKDSDSMEVKELRAIVNKLIAAIENDGEFISFYSDRFKDGTIETIQDGSLYNTTLYISALDPEIKIEKFLERSEIPMLEKLLLAQC